MNRKLLSLSVAGVIGLVGTMPLAYAQDVECDGVLVQSRFALANCMLESAAAIAAAHASEQGCPEGEWNIDAIVPELYLATIPVQGLLKLSNGTDYVELTGQSSAQLKNNVNCQVNTTASGNTFGGVDVTYATGSGNFYIDAIVEKDLNLLCITSAQSEANISLGAEDFDEQNSLAFDEEGDVITAKGLLNISASSGQGQGSGQGQSTPLSAWNLEEAVTIPDLGETAQEGFEFEAVTDDIGPCKVEIEGDVQNLFSYIVEGETGGLTISGTLKVEKAEVEQED